MHFWDVYQVYIYLNCFKSYSDEEWRFMYKINQGHLTIFCIVFVWLGGPPSPVRIITQVPWFMYQNRLGPSGSICHPNFVPCFVVLYLNSKQERSFQNWETLEQMSITYFSELSGIKRWEWSRFLFNYYSMEDQRYSARLSSKKLIHCITSILTFCFE